MDFVGIKFSYHRDPKNPKRVLTIARQIVDAPERHPGKRMIRFGWTICSPKDKFSKAMGRKISVGRMKSKDRKFSFGVEGFFIVEGDHPKDKVFNFLKGCKPIFNRMI